MIAAVFEATDLRAIGEHPACSDCSATNDDETSTKTLLVSHDSIFIITINCAVNEHVLSS